MALHSGLRDIITSRPNEWGGGGVAPHNLTHTLPLKASEMTDTEKSTARKAKGRRRDPIGVYHNGNEDEISREFTVQLPSPHKRLRRLTRLPIATARLFHGHVVFVLPGIICDSKCLRL